MSLTEDMRAAGTDPFDRAQQRLRKKAAVLKAAATAFNRRGFANTSMDEVAATLGISKPSLYQYFKSKQEILYQCHLLAVEHGEAGVVEAQATSGSGLAKFLTYVRRYLRGYFDDLGSCAVLLDVYSLSGEHVDEIVRRRDGVTRAVQEFIDAGIADGSIVDCDPTLATFFAFGAVNWMSVWYRPTGARSPDEIIETFTRLFTSGMAARPPAGT
ncbi:TetR/AcrR family transcriptional regulator [Chelatococcus reniformis]|uniref:TetR family transcriptional regulator n=1 Tax=Chelatococcus reniformis TaxID=1494448 RepID=A0A916UL31_9HYPH|nr:TetR/AcrR family transcriptional regulator [Chelatococcus reniformis]GGC77424.1 TetR family transcriptional regulator [Chelatococcus reniformis]